MNVKTHELYSDKLTICVLNFNIINRVDDIIKSTKLYMWAKLFIANTWEEVEELSQADETINEAVVTLKTLSEEDKIRLQCEGREKYNWDMASATAKGRREGRAEGRAEGINDLIEVLIDLGTDEDDIIKTVTKKYGLTHEEILDIIGRYE